MEKIDKLTVVHLRHEVKHDIRHSIVDAMEYNTRYYRARSVIHPAQYKPYQGAMYKLWGVEMHASKDKCRSDNGHPMPLFACHIEQASQHGSTENHLFGHSSHKTNSHISQWFAHDFFKQMLLRLGHSILCLLNNPLRRQYRTQCRHRYPKEYKPWFCSNPSARYWRPLAP